MDEQQFFLVENIIHVELVYSVKWLWLNKEPEHSIHYFDFYYKMWVRLCAVIKQLVALLEWWWGQYGQRHPWNHKDKHRNIFFLNNRTRPLRS